MELIIYSPTEDQFLKSIDFNFDELKNELELRLAKYQNLTYTDETINDAKIDRATLNKFYNALDEKRKEVKRAVLEPYNKFEDQIKILLKMTQDPITKIDEQVKAYENGIRDIKKGIITEYYEEKAGSLLKLIPINKIFNEKWLNKTYKEKDILNEIDEFIDNVAKDLAMIDEWKSEHDIALRETYYRTLSIHSVLERKHRLEEIQAETEKTMPKAEEPKQEVVKPEIIEHVEEVELEELEFRVWVTSEQKSALISFFRTNNIKVGKVR